MTKILIERFIGTLLLQGDLRYPPSFADAISRLATGLTDVFLDVAATAVRQGFDKNIHVIAHGALNDLVRFESIVDAAVDVLSPSEGEREATEAGNLDIVNEVFSLDHHFPLNDDEYGHNAGECHGNRRQHALKLLVGCSVKRRRRNSSRDREGSWSI